MKKLINIILFAIFINTIQLSVSANIIDRTISKSEINKGAVSVSVRDTKNGQIIYALNDKTPKNPASTLKIITLSAAVDTLGEDFEFSTELYKNTNNELYLKLAGDPFFTSSNLNKLFQTAMSKKITEPKAIYIDDYVFNDVEWGEGWQWDDDLNPLMPKFSSYNIDKNILDIIITPTQNGAPAEIHTGKFYPVTFMNLVTTGDRNQLEIARNNSISPNIINLSGIVKKQIVKQIPINYPKRYFILRCEEAIKSSKMYYYGKFDQKKTPNKNIYLVDKITHPINMAIEDVLKRSNNLTAESIYKAAGAKFVKNTGSQENSEKMLNSYFDKTAINYDNIRVVDGSGVSKNNLLTSDFMSLFLVKNYANKTIVNSLPTAGEGTLSNRMLYFKDNIKAKTGTLADVSAIAGYITTRSGKVLAFDIMINDPKTKSADKKTLEEYILRDLYTNF